MSEARIPSARSAYRFDQLTGIAACSVYEKPREQRAATGTEVAVRQLVSADRTQAARSVGSRALGP
jgi:hypothetical protein